jgi:predicted  nucleic acid-binding Zn-ribbon protein
MTLLVSEDLLTELDALRKLIERLDHEIERLRRQLARTEQAARWAVGPRPRDDDDGSD